MKTMEKLQKENRLLKIKIEELESSLELAKEKLGLLENLNKNFLANYKQRFESFEMDAENLELNKITSLEYARELKEFINKFDKVIYKILYE